MRRTASGNLIELDIAAILDRLRDANDSIFNRSNSLIRSIQALLEESHVAEHQLLAAADRLKRQKRELSGARLSDTKVFKEAIVAIEGLFKAYEQGTKASIEKIQQRLTDLIREDREQTTATPIAITRDGEILGEIRSAVDPQVSVRFETKWDVATISRPSLDLESLRPYFTEFELKNVCKRHLAAAGPNSLSGVTYRKVPKL